MAFWPDSHLAWKACAVEADPAGPDARLHPQPGALPGVHLPPRPFPGAARGRGPRDGLVRLSGGSEEVDDIRLDLEQTLA